MMGNFCERLGMLASMKINEVKREKEKRKREKKKAVAYICRNCIEAREEAARLHLHFSPHRLCALAEKGDCSVDNTGYNIQNDPPLLPFNVAASLLLRSSLTRACR